jgi:surface protein
VTDMHGMFAEASRFNSNISNWNVSAVTAMQYMFSQASSFNHNLCPWGPKLLSTFNYDINAADMFDHSGCASRDSPTGPTGPWCAVTCTTA